MKTALVLDGELKSALAIVRSLGMRGIEVACGSTRKTGMALASRYCMQPFVYRSPLGDPEGFIEDVIAAAKKMPSPPLIYCSSDATLLLISRNREKFEGVARILLPPKDIVEQASSKKEITGLARELGIKTPQEFTPQSLEEFSKLGVFYPAVIKPRHTASWHGRGKQDTAAIVAEVGELVRQARRMHDASNEWPLVQEFLHGGEYGIEVLAKDGRIIGLAAHKRIRSLNPRGGASVVKVTLEPTSAMQEATASIITQLRWSGVAMLEFKENTPGGDPVFLEMNGRFWGSLPLALHAGTDFPWGYYELGRGEPVTLGEAKVGIQSRHFWGDVRWLMSVLFASDPLRRQLYPSRFSALADFFTFGYRPDVWSWSDPKPAFSEVCDIFSSKILKQI